MTTILVNNREPLLPEALHRSRLFEFGAIAFSASLWGLSLGLPVWETRSTTGEWNLVRGMLPALIGWLGIFVWCPAWFANLLLLPTFFTLFKGRSTGFWLSVVAFVVAASAYTMPALHGDNEEAAIVGRMPGFYLWLGSFLVMVLAHALRAPADDRATGGIPRVAAIAGLLLLVAFLEWRFRVGVSPLEATLKDENDVAAFAAVLARHPSQAEKDAALPWVVLTDVSHSKSRSIRTRRLELLLTAGVNVNQRDQSGETPLMAAVQTRGGEAAVSMLVRAGANVNARDYRGKTVLDMAEERDSSRECCQILIDAGAVKSSEAKGLQGLRAENPK